MPKGQSILIATLVVLWTVIPTLRCLIPSETMSAAEHTCCKKMAGECGTMQSAHLCCKKAIAAPQNALKASTTSSPDLPSQAAEALGYSFIAVEQPLVMVSLVGPSPPASNGISTILRI